MGHYHTPARVSGWGGVRAARSGADAVAAGRGEVAPAPSFTVRLLLAALRVYQGFLSPLLPSACKFYPSCSRYAYEAIEVHGARRGAWLAARRVLRCRPFSPGGVDPVPERAASQGDEVARR